MESHISGRLEQASEASVRDRADAARYAVLQRIAPALRHDMVINLQPIGLIHELVEHRTARQQADLGVFQESCARMGRLGKAALARCIETSSWLEPDADAITPLAEGVGECVALLDRAFGFAGFKLINEVGDAGLDLPRDAVRHTLTAALLATVDTASEAADVLLRSTRDSQELVLSITVIPHKGRRVQRVFQEGCRRLSWEDVKSVALAESIDFARSDRGVNLGFAL